MTRQTERAIADNSDAIASLTDRLDELEAHVLGDTDGDELDADTPPTADELERDNTRDELDAIARDAGVDGPESLNTKGDVAEAIVQARQ